VKLFLGNKIFFIIDDPKVVIILEVPDDSFCIVIVKVLDQVKSPKGVLVDRWFQAKMTDLFVLFIVNIGQKPSSIFPFLPVCYFVYAIGFQQIPILFFGFVKSGSWKGSMNQDLFIDYQVPSLVGTCLAAD
jgi:hypothetical protein